MDATEKGYAVIRSFEGRALKAYRDCVGVWTIGFGLTNNDTWAVKAIGRPIGAGVEITDEQCESLLHESIKRGYAPAVDRAMPNAKPNEADAGISFHYNTGAIGRASWVGRWREKAGDAVVRSGLMAWNKGGGRELAGLTRRRAREAAMIISGDYGPEGRSKPPVLNANGRVVPATSPDHHLNGTPGMLRAGDKGPNVRDLNDDLVAIGLRELTGEVFDAATDKAVRSFQSAHPQLTADGIAGPATRAAIKREADAKRQLKTGTGVTAGPTGAVIAGDQATGGHLPMTVYIILGVIVAATIAWVAWKYRDELMALAKRK